MSYRTAHLVSVVLHPVLMPTYALLLLFYFSPYLNFTTNAEEKFLIYAITIFNTLVMPVLITYLLLKKGFIHSFNLDKKEERLIPFIANTVLLMIAYFMFQKIGLPRIFNLLLLGAAAAVIMAIIINLKWKISIHMIGIGGITGMFFGLSHFLLGDFRVPIMLSILLAGLAGTARLSMDAHQSPQVYAGFLVGFCCEFFILSI